MKVLVIVFISLFIYLNGSSQDLFNQKMERALPFTNTPVTLNPSWVKQWEEFNGQEQKVIVSPASYYSINRKWKNSDKIKLVFHYRFHLKTMPDDPNVLAIFYGPYLLAFETSSELILKGSKENILKNLSVSGNNVFHLTDNGKTYTLRPFYDIVNQSYGVYATIREY